MLVVRAKIERIRPKETIVLRATYLNELKGTHELRCALSVMVDDLLRLRRRCAESRSAVHWGGGDLQMIRTCNYSYTTLPKYRHIHHDKTLRFR